MKKTKDKTESGPTFYQTPNGKFLPSVYASALGRYYFNGGSFDMPRQQMYMPLDVVNANGGPIYPQNPLLNKPKSLAYNNQKVKSGVTNLPEVPIHPPSQKTGDSTLENIWEIFDPSGFSSYNDVYDSYKKTGMSPETMLEVAGALPVVGKFGKIIKGMKIGTDIFKEAKLSKALRVMDKIGKVSSANDAISPPSIELIRATQQKSKGGYLAPILPMHFDKGTKIFRDTTALPFAHGGKLMDFPAASLSEREANINYNVYASMPGRYYSNGGQFLTAGGEYHRIYKNAEGDIMVNHPAEDKGKWDTINLTDKSGANTVAQGVAATKQWHIDNPNSYGNGGMIKRADGSYSQRGLWDNIRANKGSGKEPTKEMLAQERKIKSNQYGLGGHKAVFFPTNVSEPGADDKDLTYPKDAYVYNNGGYVNPIKNSNLVNNFNSGGNMNFKSNAAYKAWLGYGHATGVFERTPGNQSVSIKGKSKDVEHNLGGYLMANGGGITPLGYPFNNATFKAFGFAEGGMMGDNPIGPPKQYSAIDYATPSEDYVKNYKSNLTAYNNNLKNKEGVPLLGGNYAPISEEKRLERLQELQSLPANQINDSILEEYHTLKSGKPFFTAGDSQYITAPVDFSKVNIPAKPQMPMMAVNPMSVGAAYNTSSPEEHYGWSAVSKARMPQVLENRAKVNAEIDANKAFLADPTQKAEWEKYKANNPTDSITKFRSMYSPNVASNNTVMMPEGFAFGGPFNNKGFQSLPPAVQAKIRANSFAEGGNMDPLTEFNTGGTHEENIMGGIPQGMGENGQPNLVEQGETKLNAEDYIFSDRLKVTKDVAEDFNMPKNYVGKTFADVSKLVNRPNSRREHDTIEETAKIRDLQNLMEAQESFKEREVSKKMQEIASLDPTALQGMMGQLQGMEQGMAPEMEEQFPQSVQPMGMPQGMAIDPSQIPPEMLAQMPEAQQGAPVMACGGHMYRCGGKMYDFGGVMKDIGAGAYGAGEGLLDTLTMGATDSITDAGYKALQRAGKSGAEDIEKQNAIRGYSNVAGAVTGAVLNPAALGSAVSEGSEGLAAGITNTKGTNEKTDKIVNTLGQVGSIAGGFVGGGSGTGALTGNKGAEALQGLGNNKMMSMGMNMGSNLFTGLAQDPNAISPEQQAAINKNYINSTPQSGGMYNGGTYANGGTMYPTNNLLGNMYDPGGPLDPSFIMMADADRKKAAQMAAIFNNPFGYPNLTGYSSRSANVNPVYNVDLQGIAQNQMSPEYNRMAEGATPMDPANIPANYYVQGLLPEQLRQDVIEPIDETITTTDIEVPQEVLTKYGKTAEEYAIMSNEERKALLNQYDSDIKKFQSKQDDKNVDLNFKQTPAQAAMQAAPAIYNMGVGAGLWGKPEYYKASDYMTAADLKPYEYNINPQITEAKNTYAQMAAYAKNMGLEPGAVASNLSNLYNNKMSVMGNLYAQKLNADAQNKQAIDAANKQIMSENQRIKLEVDTQNRALKAAKLGYLQTGIGQVADIGRNNQLTDLQLKHLGVLSPDYAGEAKYTSGWQSMFDSFKNLNKNKNTEEKIYSPEEYRLG